VFLTDRRARTPLPLADVDRDSGRASCFTEHSQAFIPCRRSDHMRMVVTRRAGAGLLVKTAGEHADDRLWSLWEGIGKD
jgi:hypothetical protein